MCLDQLRSSGSVATVSPIEERLRLGLKSNGGDGRSRGFGFVGLQTSSTDRLEPIGDFLGVSTIGDGGGEAIRAGVSSRRVLPSLNLGERWGWVMVTLRRHGRGGSDRSSSVRSENPSITQVRRVDFVRASLWKKKRALLRSEISGIVGGLLWWFVLSCLSTKMQGIP